MIITQASMLYTDDNQVAHAEYYQPVGISWNGLKALWAVWGGIQYIYNEDGTLFGMVIEPDPAELEGLSAWLENLPQTLQAVANETPAPEVNSYGVDLRSWAAPQGEAVAIDQWMQTLSGSKNVH